MSCIHTPSLDISFKVWNGVYYMNMKTSPNDVSNQELLEGNREILEAIGAFAGSVDSRFEEVRGEIHSLKNEVSGMKKAMVTKDELRNEIDKLKTTMVTKGYLDDKLADFHSDIIQHTRKEIEKAMH